MSRRAASESASAPPATPASAPRAALSHSLPDLGAVEAQETPRGAEPEDATATATAAPESAPPSPERRDTLREAWWDAIRRNAITTDDAVRFSVYLQETCASPAYTAGPIGVADIDAGDIVTCWDVSADARGCLHCTISPRRFSHNFHIIKFSRTWYFAEWLARERIDIDVHLVPSGEASFMTNLLGKKIAMRPVLVATRSMVPCGEPPRARLTLASLLRDKFREHNALRPHVIALRRAHIAAALRRGDVGPIKLERMLSSEIAACVAAPGDDADADADAAADADADAQGRSFFRIGRGGCAYCWQGAPLFNGMHIVPYTRAHALVDWLMMRERLSVALEFERPPSEPTLDAPPFPSDTPPSNAPHQSLYTLYVHVQ